MVLLLVELPSQTQQLLLNALLLHYFLMSSLLLGRIVVNIIRENVSASRRCIPVLLIEEPGRRAHITPRRQRIWISLQLEG